MLKNQVDAEVLAEVVDQSISLIQTLQEPGEIQPSNIIALNSLAGAITKLMYWHCYGFTSLPLQ